MCCCSIHAVCQLILSLKTCIPFTSTSSLTHRLLLPLPSLHQDLRRFSQYSRTSGHLGVPRISEHQISPLNSSSQIGLPLCSGRVVLCAKIDACIFAANGKWPQNLPRYGTFPARFELGSWCLQLGFERLQNPGPGFRKVQLLSTPRSLKLLRIYDDWSPP